MNKHLLPILLLCSPVFALEPISTITTTGNNTKEIIDLLEKENQELFYKCNICKVNINAND